MEDDRSPSEINPNDRGYESPGARYYGIPDPPSQRDELHCDEREWNEEQQMPSAIERLLWSTASRVDVLDGYARGIAEMAAIRFDDLGKGLTNLESMVPRMGDAIVVLVEIVKDLGHRVDRLEDRLESLGDEFSEYVERNV